MWKSLGIICGKHCKTKSKIPHPQDPAKWLRFLADVSHLFKNIKYALVNGQAFTLLTETDAKHGLKCNVASVKPRTEGPSELPGRFGNQTGSKAQHDYSNTNSFR